MNSNDTHSSCRLQNSRTWFYGGKGPGGSLSIKFYVFMHNIDGVIERFSVISNHDSVPQRSKSLGTRGAYGTKSDLSRLRKPGS